LLVPRLQLAPEVEDALLVFGESIPVAKSKVRNRERPLLRRVAHGAKGIPVIAYDRSMSIAELRSGSRRRKMAEVKAEVACRLVEGHGITIAEVARQFGVSTSAISKTLARGHST